MASEGKVEVQDYIWQQRYTRLTVFLCALQFSLRAPVLIICKGANQARGYTQALRNKQEYYPAGSQVSAALCRLSAALSSSALMSSLLIEPQCLIGLPPSLQMHL